MTGTLGALLTLLLAAGSAAAPAAAPGAAGSAVPPEHLPWLEALDRADACLATTTGYTATFHKTERIRDRLVVGQVYRIKFMKPHSVYMEWINPKGTGGEAIYVEGWNRNRVRVHPGGFWGLLTFNLKTDSRWLMKDSRHPITRIGIHNLTRLIGENIRRAVAANELTSIHHGSLVFFSRPVIALEGILPADPARGYWCRRALVYFDGATGLPINIRNYDWNDDLVEEYGYADLRLDNALSASDFDPANPAYRF